MTAVPAPAPEAVRSVHAPDTAVGLTYEHLAYMGLLALSAFVHVWMLGERALHHDETLHGTYSWFIYVGRGYIHDPLLHGPLLYHLGALTFALFGDNDLTARLSGAVFGTLLTVMPFLIRREIGRIAAFAASVYLLISPVFLYVGRFFRHDIYSGFFELLVVVAVVRFAADRRPLWLFVGVAAFALMYVNQETSYLYLLMIGTPLLMLMLWRVYRPGVAVVGGLGVALALLVFVLPGEAVVDGGHVASVIRRRAQCRSPSRGPSLAGNRSRRKTMPMPCACGIERIRRMVICWRAWAATLPIWGCSSATLQS